MSRIKHYQRGGNCWSLILFIPLAAAADETATVRMKAGFAEKDITPKIGSVCAGGYSRAVHQSIHDPCKVRASVFDDGKNKIAIVGLDALLIPRPIVVAARQEIAKKCDLRESAIMVAASHSHSSGPVGWIQPADYAAASDQIRKLADEESSPADPKYLQQVQEAIVAAVCQAYDSRSDVRCGVGVGHEDKVAFNRRFKMKNGRTFTHPGKGNPDIARPAGPIDPEVSVVGAWNEQDKLVGCVVMYACHATTDPGGVSANYIYWLEKMIRGAFDKETIVVFLEGCGGDITQVDNLSTSASMTGKKYAERVGGRIGAEAVRVLLSMDAGVLTPIGDRQQTVVMQRRPPSAAHVAEAFATLAKDRKTVDGIDWLMAKETVLLDALIHHESAPLVEVQALQLGPAIFLGEPVELFCVHGLEMKQKSGFPFTFPVNLANGALGYAPTEDSWGDEGGGFETRLTSDSNLEIMAGRKITDIAIELARQFKPGAVPKAPPAPPFRAPWNLGNDPAELQ